VSANAASPARKSTTKPSAPKAPRARAAKHSKAVVEESVPPAAPLTTAVVETAVVNQPAAIKSISRDDIAQLAYSYWADRGYQGGNPHEDWIRAEVTLLSV
jgi:hypothetical protein